MTRAYRPCARTVAQTISSGGDDVNHAVETTVDELEAQP